MADRPRLAWLDGIKGISILWIAFFHAFGSFTGDTFPSPIAPRYVATFFESCTASGPVCALEAFLLGIAKTGFHAVGVFLLLSGFGLTLGLLKRGDPDGGWGRWYYKRLIRLFPLYWLAHILYIISPGVARPEPADYRWFLSILGDRIWPVESIFYYMNPALWYFGTLLQLYLLFPLLFRLLQRIGTEWFLVACAMFTFGSRFVMLEVVPVHGYWVQGAFGGARLFEFAFGMALAAWMTRNGESFERRLFAPAMIVAGGLLYTAGLYSYPNLTTYVFTDALIGVGLFILLAHLARWLVAVPILGSAVGTVGAFSYGLYLLHQPYVTFFADSVRGWPLAAFVPTAMLLVALLAAIGVPLERGMNRLVDRITG